MEKEKMENEEIPRHGGVEDDDTEVAG